MGPAYAESLQRLAPMLSIRVRRSPKLARKLGKPKFLPSPEHVSPLVRYRVTLAELARSASRAGSGQLKDRILWALRDLCKPGLRSSLVRARVDVYQVVIKLMRQRD